MSISSSRKVLMIKHIVFVVSFWQASVWLCLCCGSMWSSRSCDLMPPSPWSGWGGSCRGQWCLSLRPRTAHVRPTFLLPTPHPGRTMPVLFTDSLSPLSWPASSMEWSTLMMAPCSQQGRIQEPGLYRQRCSSNVEMPPAGSKQEWFDANYGV